MELQEKVAHLPLEPGVYLFKDAAETILYVGKAGVLRHRVRSYFLESAMADAKTGSLVREIADVDCIVVDNEKEALALENHLIKRHKPKFNILLRDDKTYPYIRFTAFEKYPRVYVTRRLKKDGSIYFGPYFPHSLAHRIVHLIHKRFLVPSCTVDLTRPHPRPCLQYYIKRCHGPCVPGLVTGERYAEAARDVRLFLEGRRTDLVRSLEERMTKAADEERFEAAANYRDLIRTVEEIEERQKIAAAQGDDTDVLAWYAEPPQVAVNVFHLRGGRVVDRRDFYWEDLAEFEPAEFLSSLLKQLYLESDYLPRVIHVPAVASQGVAPATQIRPPSVVPPVSPTVPGSSPADSSAPVAPDLQPSQSVAPATRIHAPVVADLQPSHSVAPATQIRPPVVADLQPSHSVAPATQIPPPAEHDFDDRALLEDVLSERAGRRVEISTPQRGQKRAFLDLVAKNAKQSFEQRFRVLKPNSKAIVEALESALGLPEPPRRIESFDVSHIQGSDTVASMVVWEDGRMKKSDYRKFIIRFDSLSDSLSQISPSAASNPELSVSVSNPEMPASGVSNSQISNPQSSSRRPRGASAPSITSITPAVSPPAAGEGSKISPSPSPLVDDFAAIREAVHRRYRRLRDEKKPLPSLILIDGGVGQLHAAAQALEELEIINQPLASIAKPPSQHPTPHTPHPSHGTRHPSHGTPHPTHADTIFVLGQEDPIRLERHSPILHLIQQIRDETHRFAVTFHRQRRTKRTVRSALLDIPGIGPATARKLLRKFGSVVRIQQASFEDLSEVVSAKQARAILDSRCL